jgi:hypothetical protein
MIAPGVTMDRPTPRRERTGIIQIVLIGAVLIAALYGGLRLLASTYEAHAARQQQRKTHAAQVQRAAAHAEQMRAAEAQLVQLAAIRRARATQDAAMRAGKLRCINGQLFRKLDNGWENLPGQRCQ